MNENPQASAIILAQRDALAEAIVTRQYQLSHFWEQFGEAGRARACAMPAIT